MQKERAYFDTADIDGILERAFGLQYQDVNLPIEIVSGSVVIGRATTTMPWPDARDAAFGTGNYGFRVGSLSGAPVGAAIRLQIFGAGFLSELNPQNRYRNRLRR